MPKLRQNRTIPPHVPNRALKATSGPHSEVRLIRMWNRGVFSCIVFVRVFGADTFPPLFRAAPKRDGRRPGHRESAFIDYCEFHLQSLALVIWINSHSVIGIVLFEMLFGSPFYCFYRALVIEQPVTFHQVQSLGEWRAKPVDHGKWADLDSHGVNHQRVAFVMANGISIPGWRHMRRMRLVQAHLAELMIERIKDRDLIGLLEQVHSIIDENEWHLLGPTLVARGWIGLAGQ